MSYYSLLTTKLKHKERQPVELPHDRGPISWKNNHLYFYLVSSLLEVPGVLVGISVVTHPQQNLQSECFLVKKIRATGEGRRQRL